MIILMLSGCSTPDDSNITDNNAESLQGGIMLEVTVEQGTKTHYPLIYVIWIENKSSKFLQNIAVSKKLISGGLTGTALPFWKMNQFPISDKSEIDAVTGATKRFQDFTVRAKLKDEKIRKFNVYCEVDRSFDANDWFKDQPAILYTVEVNLDKTTNEYELKPCGWTPNEITENIIPDTPKGKLQKDIRYITNFKNAKRFGDIDISHQGTNMIKKITLNINR